MSSAIYRHYAGRDEVLAAVICGVRDIVMDSLDASKREGADALRSLRLMHRQHVRFLRESGSFSRLFSSEEAFLGRGPRARQVRDLVKSLLGRVAGLVARGQEEGSIRGDVDRDTAALMFMGLFAPAVVLMGSLPAPKREVGRRLRSMWELFASALAAGPLASGSVGIRPKAGPRALGEGRRRSRTNRGG